MPSLQEAVQYAYAACQRGAWEEAEQSCRAILHAQADNFDALFLLGIIAGQGHRLPEAVELLNRALMVDPNHADAHYNRGVALGQLARHAEALASYDRAIALRPDYADVYTNRGFALDELGRHAEALASYAHALALKPEDAEAHNHLGIALRRQKRHTEALHCFDRALALRPDHADTHNNLGNALRDLGRHKDALTSYERALALDPGHADAHYNRGLALADLGRHEEARASFEHALARRPDHADAHYGRGQALARLLRYPDALQSYQRVLALRPGDALACNDQGNVLRALGQYAEAVASYEQAIALKPDFADAFTNRGIALGEHHRYAEALESHDRALALDPERADAHYNRGYTLLNQKRYAEALASFERAVALDPRHTEALNNRGNVQRELRRYAEALASYDRALAQKPKYADAWNNRGNVLVALARHAEALASFERAVLLKTDYARAYANRGNALADLARYAEAVESYAQALSIEPGLDYLYGNWLHARMKICDWSDAARCFAELALKIERREKASPPFPVLAIPMTAQAQRTVAQVWAQDNYPQGRALPEFGSEPGRGRIRVGYFSADFREHAVSLLTAELFEQHDKSRFELVAFSYGPDSGDATRKRLVAAFDRFIDVRSLADDEVAQLARAQGVDIAIDLGGYTKGSRMGIFAARAAPVQASYLGYLGTLGADFIDYLIADRTIVPVERQDAYAEKIVYLPSYQTGDSRRRIAEPAFTREALGLPPEGFVFCCFNNSYKITPRTFDGWMRIVQRVERSVLFLYGENPWVPGNLRKEAVARGVDPDRLVFGDRLPPAEYLARYRAADLFLDTFPYNAGTTANDALWTGLPLLTLAGETFAGRVAASLLHAIGLPELIAHSQEEYEALAIDLGTHPDRMRQIREKLARNRLTAPLFDTPRFARHLEAAYTAMHERYKAGLPPEQIHVQA